ncbi:MAG: aconitate hydratase AcnA, partial [Gammaproteobacteria bacterium]
MQDSFKSRATLNVGGKHYEIFKLDALEAKHKVSRLPYSLKILLENMLRLEDGVSVTKADIEALASCDPRKLPQKEIAFTPARVILQDFTGVPAVVDLAAMRDAMQKLGGDPKKINPLCPAELVIDHSVMVDFFGNKEAFGLNAKLEFDRNKERYAFLRWGQNALRNFKVVPPDTGIVHQVNLEFLARVVFVNDKNQAYPDTVVGTDSHTTMINGVGVLGWGVGGIEAEAAMLGQPSTMLIPEVIGVRFTGKLAEGATATDLVLTVTEMLRKRGVVEKFVEFFGDGLKYLPLADRATIANMAPEYGATCGIFPIDDETLTYLRLTGRGEDDIKLVEAYAKAQGMWRHDGQEAVYTDVLSLDLGSIKPSLAGPKRPQDRVLLNDMAKNYSAAFEKEQTTRKSAGPAKVKQDGKEFDLKDGAVVIAAITSCTNTSNPAVLVAAGLLARKAHAKGLNSKPWVKTSLAPGSKVVTEYLKKANLMADLESIGFFLAGYGCTTCIGNSGPLSVPISKAVNDNKLAVAAVLSGNRNFEGRVHQDVRMNYLASPPLVVAFALAGSVNLDLTHDPLGTGNDGKPVYLKDIWPSQKEIQETIARSLDAAMFKKSYRDVFHGDEHWRGMQISTGDIYQWGNDSTYVQNPPYFDGMSKQAPGIPAIKGARCLALFGDSITTDHISPAGAIKKDSPAGKYLMANHV